MIQRLRQDGFVVTVNSALKPKTVLCARVVEDDRSGAAAQNFIRLIEAGASGQYGFYEALDYTSTRVSED